MTHGPTREATMIATRIPGSKGGSQDVPSLEREYAEEQTSHKPS